MTSSILFMLALSWPAATPASQPADAEEGAVRGMITAYVEAYNRADPAAVAEFFTTDADYVQEDGDVLHGRQAIRDEIAKTFQDQKGARLAVQISTFEFPRRNMAIVRGNNTVTLDHGEASSVNFRAAEVKQNDKWLIKNIEEIGPGGEALDQLNWMIGSWVDEDENASIHTDCRWTPNKRFITRSFTASYKDGPELKGTEVIGWDPAARSIRSWVFDSDGSFGQSVWTHRGDEWIAKARGVLPDGSRASAIHIFHILDPDKYTWESVDREVDGEIMPNIGPVAIVRSETQPADSSSPRLP